MLERDNRDISSGFTFRERMLLGVKSVSEVVGTTLGPKGRNVIIERKWGLPSVTKDGVTVAKEIHLEDSVANMAAQLVKSAAVRTNEKSGDGTSTSTVLADSLYSAAMDAVGNGTPQVVVKEALEKVTKEAVEFLKSKSVKVEGEMIRQVASISANDPKIGELVYGVLKDDPHRVVTVEVGNGMETEVESTEGLRIDKGMISPYMMTDPEKGEAVLENPCVILVDGKVSSAFEIAKALECAVKGGFRSALVIADDVEGEALATMVVNTVKGTFQSLAVKAPGFGKNKSDTLMDIASVVGGKVVSKESGLSLMEPKFEMLGKCRRVTSNGERTVIVSDSKSDAVEKRASLIDAELKKAESEFDRTNLTARLAKLRGGVTAVKVGAPTEADAKELKDRVEDAVQASVAAYEEGILPGSGNALATFAEEYGKIRNDNVTNLFLKALQAPYELIYRNAELPPDDVRWNTGKNLLTNEATDDLIKSGVIDPTKVVRTALENASSVAGVLLMADAGMTFVKKKGEKDELNPDGSMPN